MSCLIFERSFSLGYVRMERELRGALRGVTREIIVVVDELEVLKK